MCILTIMLVIMRRRFWTKFSGMRTSRMKLFGNVKHSLTAIRSRYVARFMTSVLLTGRLRRRKSTLSMPLTTRDYIESHYASIAIQRTKVLARTTLTGPGTRPGLNTPCHGINPPPRQAGRVAREDGPTLGQRWATLRYWTKRQYASAIKALP